MGDGVQYTKFMQNIVVFLTPELSDTDIAMQQSPALLELYVYIEIVLVDESQVIHEGS